MKKPKDFWIPCSWKDRKPLLLDRLFYIPENYENHKKSLLPEFSNPQIFEKTKPVILEYCSGNGQWIIDKAKCKPQYNWIAVENRFDRVRKIWLKMQNQNLTNLFVVFGEANAFTRFYLQENSVFQSFINFPDPWPKNKHSKHRLVQTDFIEELKRVIERDGMITLVTDDQKYLMQMIQTFEKVEGWKPTFEKSFVTEWPSFGSSFFQVLWKEKGREIFYLQYQNCG